MKLIKNGKHITRAGNIHWFKNNLLHRENGPALEEKNGWVSWYFEGQLHRDDGTDEPACIYKDGHKQWWSNGVLHRETGPAVIHANGKVEWYINGQNLSSDEFTHWLAKKTLNQKLHTTLAQSPIQKKNKI